MENFISSFIAMILFSRKYLLPNTAGRTDGKRLANGLSVRECALLPRQLFFRELLVLLRSYWFYLKVLIKNYTTVEGPIGGKQI